MDGSIAALIAESAAGREGVERVEAKGSFAYLWSGRDFVILEADGAASFRLGPVLAPAALRTPDVRESAHGVGWVRFAPPRIDRFARDRATSWFEAALRRAEEA